MTTFSFQCSPSMGRSDSENIHDKPPESVANSNDITTTKTKYNKTVRIFYGMYCMSVENSFYCSYAIIEKKEKLQAKNNILEYQSPILKRKCHFDEIFIIGCILTISNAANDENFIRNGDISIPEHRKRIYTPNRQQWRHYLFVCKQVGVFCLPNWAWLSISR